MKYLIFSVSISLASIVYTNLNSEHHRQEGFEAAQAMYDACAQEADETSGETERKFQAEYIRECVADTNRDDHAGYTVGVQ